MPNPKIGTVTMDVRKAVEESKAGKVEYRTDRTAIVHMVYRQVRLEGSASWSRTTPPWIEELLRAKPAGAKGRYMKSLSSSTSTMGPGIKVDPSKTRDLVGAEQNEAEAAATAA